MKKRILIPIIAIIIAGCASIGSQQQPDEPVYGGKPLSFWVMQLENCDILGVNFHPSAEVVQAIRSIGPAAVPYLTKWMWQSDVHDTAVGPGTRPRPPESTNAPTHREVAMAFRVLGTEGKAAIPELEKMVSAPYNPTLANSSFVDVVESLVFLGPEVVPIMLKKADALQGPDLSLDSKAFVIEHIGWMRSDGEAAIPALVAWAGDKEAWVRRAALSSLGNIGRNPGLVVPVLMAHLKDEDLSARQAATRGLGAFGKDAKAAAPALVNLVDDPNFYVRRDAIFSLGKIGEQLDLLVPRLIRQLKDEEDDVRFGAAIALGEIGGPAAIDALVKAKDDANVLVQKAVLESLKKLDQNH